MKTLVVYDSLYGNTRTIAQAIADAIPGDVKLLHAGDVDASELGAYGLLIVGAPTHGGRASEPARDLLEKIQAPALAGIRVAAFDTRLTWWWLRVFGFAAPRVARSLEKKGGTLVVEPEGFFVTGSEGPLEEGEVERAGTWAQEVVALAEKAATSS
jgi:flavodoxin I